MINIISNNYMCFDALLEYIISCVSPLSHLTQTDLAEIFGITLPYGAQTSIHNVKYSNNITDCGTNINIISINKFFNDYSIPLQLSYISPAFFDEITFVDIIQKYIGDYIVFAFDYGLLYKEPQNNDVGHVALLENIDVISDCIQIYDPGPRNYGSRIVKVDDMVYAMKRRGGIYLFKNRLQ